MKTAITALYISALLSSGLAQANSHATQETYADHIRKSTAITDARLIKTYSCDSKAVLAIKSENTRQLVAEACMRAGHPGHE